jgi:alpha/beta superfamily hydrolase
MKQTRISFASGELLLEGMLATPQGIGPFPAAIVCHPHPLYGGSMENNVVCRLSEALTQASFVSLKLKDVDRHRIGLAGYSAGAGFALPVGSTNPRISALGAVSPPINTFDFEFLRSCTKPKFLISGDKDDLISVEQFLEFCSNLPEPKDCESVEGADHFWWGYESHLAAKMTAFFVRVL